MDRINTQTISTEVRHCVPPTGYSQESKAVASRRAYCAARSALPASSSLAMRFCAMSAAAA
eukprot:scaffold88227_cov51-Phaeocystis_antarctica.AAC.1